MQNLFTEVTTLDERCVQRFSLSEEVMMEHAAMGMERWIREHIPLNASVLILSGSGNNGADGLALARLLSHDYHVHLYLPFGAQTPLCQLQRERTEKISLLSVKPSGDYDVVVDALFGSGLSRPLGPTAIELLEYVNTLQCTKISCDIPSGIFADGTVDPYTFIADITITMGGLKRSLFSDAAKECVGEIIVVNLGVSRNSYEIDSSWKLLEIQDLRLPHRKRASAHKGTFGHLAVVCGEKIGASIIAGSAALRFGTGLVSLISNENVQIPHELMQSHSLPATTTAIALGMGLGSEFCDDELTALLNNELPLVLDADIFYHPIFPKLLKHPQIVLTPHPKEFVHILKVCNIADIDVATLQKNRFEYSEKFCAAFPHAVLILKGSNVIIGSGTSFYVNPHGTVALAKGGSGDVLAGLTGALLAQGYPMLEASIQASLAHTIASQTFGKNDYSLTPFDLIESIRTL